MSAEIRSELTELIRLLVDRPDDVRVTERQQRRQLRFDVRVHAEDMGILIGRQGRTVWALRELLAFRGSRDGKSYGLAVLDD